MRLLKDGDEVVLGVVSTAISLESTLRSVGNTTYRVSMEEGKMDKVRRT